MLALLYSQLFEIDLECCSVTKLAELVLNPCPSDLANSAIFGRRLPALRILSRFQYLRAAKEKTSLTVAAMLIRRVLMPLSRMAGCAMHALKLC